MPSGSLTVVGTGIQAAGQLTAEARLAVEQADEALYLVVDPTTAAWIERANPKPRSLSPFYEQGKDRRGIFGATVDETVSPVSPQPHVLAIPYGHPGGFAWPGHEPIRLLHAEGVLD